MLVMSRRRRGGARTRPRLGTRLLPWNSSVCEAVDAFREENNGLPPLSGPIPDMHADTNSFVALQRLYRDKALSDLQGVQAHFDSLVKDTFSRAPSQEDSSYSRSSASTSGTCATCSTKFG